MQTVVSKISNYVNFLQGTETLEKGYPWITLGAIIALEDILHNPRKKYQVLEMGSGGSTVFFADRCKYVLSYETNEKWKKMVEKRLAGYTNVKIVCGNEETLRRHIRKQKNGSFDIILADSGTSYRVRRRLLEDAESKLKYGGFLIIDNYDHKDLKNYDYSGYDVCTFDMFRYSCKGTRICRKI